MAILKSSARIYDATGHAIGEGVAYVHLPHGRDTPQAAGGTISLRRWEPDGDDPAYIVLEDGRRLDIAVTQSALSDCSRNHILRFATSWPPRTPGA
jgi:hypothetical protein